MLKPIVSMNQMAMNESIATTCCYTWNGNVTGSASVLHGGKLDVSYSYRYFYPQTYTGTKANGWKDAECEISKGWLNVGVAPSRDNMSAAQHDYVPYQCGGEWCLEGKVLTKFGGLEIADGVKDWVIKTPNFYTSVKTGTNITHVGATSAHYRWTSGNSWLADHEAVQFSS